MTFAYRSFDRDRQSVLSLAQAVELADLFERLGVSGPYATDYKTKTWRYDHKGKPVEESAYVWEVNDELRAWCSGLPEFWTCDVAHILRERGSWRFLQRQWELFNAIEHPGIRAHMLANFNRRGYDRHGCGEPCDMTWMAKACRQSRSTQTRGPYEPSGSARLKLREAILCSTTQEAYSDDRVVAIPVEGEVTAESKARLHQLAGSLKTHNGWAGSGCTHSLTLSECGTFVLLYTRASISD